MPTLDPELLYQCMCAMMGNWPRLLGKPTASVDAIFVWGRAQGEYELTTYNDGVLHCAAQLYRKKKCPIAIPSYLGQDFDQGLTGYAGHRKWQKILTGYEVPPGFVMPIPGDGHNTKTESDDFLAFAQTNGWTRVMAVSQPAHVLRAMLGVVQSLKKHSLVKNILVYPFYAQRFDFKAEVYGSQGVGPHPALQWIQEEFDRIPLYQERGDLASLEELWKYIQLLYKSL